MRNAFLFVGGMAMMACPASNSNSGAQPSGDNAVVAAKSKVSGALDTLAKAVPEAVKPKNDALSAFQPNDVVLDHAVKTLDGKTQKLSDFRGKALLVVNTASECGFTPQYADLQKLYATYRERGLEILAFPSNDFGAQEPGTAEQIRAFVDEGYSVQFPMFDKVHTKGAEQAPLYKTLSEATGAGIKGEVQWNFTKFLVDPKGRVVGRFEPAVTPMAPELVAALEQVLPKGL